MRLTVAVLVTATVVLGAAGVLYATAGGPGGVLGVLFQLCLLAAVVVVARVTWRWALRARPRMTELPPIHGPELPRHTRLSDPTQPPPSRW
ncbi:hypothetical protein CCO02nite_03080 [Cellulomonas composti]|uniref:Uncharacterized protein n=1 Tax=Cellulomonas composti TaxID=266130 RepID=A0A511J6L6_9CELL|nr:hypothetical protein CCO02nite_03080 [Cellulomonas composti]